MRFIKHFFVDFILSILFICASLFWFFPVQFVEYGTLTIIVIGLVLIIFLWKFNIEKYWQIKNKKISRGGEAIFLDDREICDPQKDELGFREDAIRFAKDVLNGNSNNPIVFGLDAPWGSGKSSYLNICKKEVWDTSEDILVFPFKPMLYDSKKQNLFDIFVNEFIHLLDEKNILEKSLKTHLRSYQRVLRGSSFGFLGFKFSLDFLFNSTSEKMLGYIRDDISDTGKKIIVIVDDLDRLYIEDIKAMLGIVRNIFYMPNMAFILCYDTNNINSFDVQHKVVHTDFFNKTETDSSINYSRASHDLNNQKINSYFEKIVQVKKTLIIKKDYLKKYFVDSLEKLVDKEYKYHFEKFKNGIEYFFTDETYPYYEPYIGDIRKIKRIVNFIAENNILKFKFRFLDPDPKGLVQLILLYINYPHIFKKIYTHEVNGAGGFFSVVSTQWEIPKRNDDKLGFENSKEYKEYIKRLSSEEKFLISELFDVESSNKKKDLEDKKDDKEFRASSPIFNGSSYEFSKNLRDYLILLMEKQVASDSDQYTFHVEKIKGLSTRKLRDVFDDNEYAPEKGERPREVFFKTLLGFVNGANSIITKEIAEDSIYYIANSLQDYSLVSDFSGIYNGLRDDLIYDLLIFLDRRGWFDDKGLSYENTEENVLSIANRIFGVGDYSEKGIIECLVGRDRGIVGIHDAAKFLQTCISDRSGLFNLQRALEYYGKKNEIDVRKHISQKIFSYFNEKYIDKENNFIEEIMDLSDKVILGDFETFIKTEFEKNGSDIKHEISKIKGVLVGHLIYQFGRVEEGSYGFYAIDKEGNEKISDKMQDYLFNVCFNLKKNKKNALYFVNYLLTSFSWTHSIRGTEFTPRLDEFTKVLNRNILKKYWADNSEDIKNYCNSVPSDSRVYTYNYVANYKDDLPTMFDELDKLKVEETVSAE